MAATQIPLLVLLVEDEPDQVEMYRLGLEAAGLRVIAATSGAEGIQRAHREQPDAIVLDVRLPDMSGWDVCVALKREPATEPIPIIILTAAAQPALEEQAEASGCAASLLKPCFPDELARRIRAVVTPHVQP
jgi:CheY-like chemotaxis protein